MAVKDLTAEEIEIALSRIDHAIGNDARISLIVAEGLGQSNRDVPIPLSHAESVPIFRALRDVIVNGAK